MSYRIVIGFLFVISNLCFVTAHTQNDLEAAIEDLQNITESLEAKKQSSEVNQDNELLKEILNKLDNIETLLVELSKHPIISDSNKYDLLLEEEVIDSDYLNKKLKDNNQDSSDKQLNEYGLALQLLKSKKYLAAEEAFMKFIQNYPQSNLIGNAYFWYADSFYHRKIYNKALNFYLKSYKNFPYSIKAPDALLKAAITAGHMHKYKEVCSLLDKLDATFLKRSAHSIDLTKETRRKFKCFT